MKKGHLRKYLRFELTISRFIGGACLRFYTLPEKAVIRVSWRTPRYQWSSPERNQQFKQACLVPFMLSKAAFENSDKES